MNNLTFSHSILSINSILLYFGYLINKNIHHMNEFKKHDSRIKQ